MQHCCNEGKVLFGACKIVATRKKWFLAFARLLQRGESAFGGLQDCCNEEKVLLRLARLLQQGKRGFWRLQQCCKHFQKHFGRYSALSKTSFRDKDPHFLSPNPHFVTWETNISIECNQDQSKYTSHKYPRVFSHELSHCRE